MHSLFGVGSMPGMAASIRLTWLLGSAPNSVAAPEKSLALDVTCAWTSRPITTSHSPVSPWMRYSLILPPSPRPSHKPGPFLDRQSRVQHALFVEGLADDLQPQ